MHVFIKYDALARGNRTVEERTGTGGFSSAKNNFVFQLSLVVIKKKLPLGMGPRGSLYHMIQEQRAYMIGFIALM